MSAARCPCCGHEEQLGAKVGWKLGLAAAPMLMGPRAMTRQPLAVFAVAALGYMVGSYLDAEVLPNCPTCKVLMKKLA